MLVSVPLQSPPCDDSFSSFLGSYQPFPIDSFPASVQRYVTAVAASHDCDPAFVALPVLSTLAAAVGSSCRLAIKQSWSEPATLWTSLVSDGRTNTRTVFDAAAAPFDACLQAPPAVRKRVVRDSRLTAVIPTLERERNGLLLRLDQLDGWLGRPNSTASRRLMEVSQWVDISVGRPVSMEIRRKDYDVALPSVSLMGTVQSQALSDKFLKARIPCELTSRLLFAAPPARPRRWTDDDVSEEVCQTYVKTVRTLTGGSAAGLTNGENDSTENASIEVQLSPNARTLFAGFVDWVGQEQRDVDELLVPWYTQLISQAARLALVLHQARFAQGDQVDRTVCDEASMQAGITMARWFAQEARRVLAVFSAAHEDVEHGRIIEWLQRRGGLATSRDLCRSNGRRYATDDAARQALDRLVEKGLGVWVDMPAGKNGGPPYQVFSLGGHQVELMPSVEEVVPVTLAACEVSPSTSQVVAKEELPRTNTEGTRNGLSPVRTASSVGQKYAKRNKRRGRFAKRR